MRSIHPGIRPGNRRAARPGFTMIAMLVVLAILGVFAVVATHLMQTTMRLYREAGSAEAHARLLGSAARQLRADAWSARRVTVAGARSVILDRGDGRSAEWQVDDAGNVLRTPRGAADAIDPPARWPDIGRRISFAWDGTSLLVRGLDRGADRAGGVRMTSQIVLSQGGGVK